MKLIVAIIVCLGLVLGYIYYPPIKPHSPMGDDSLPTGLVLAENKTAVKRRVVGFLPYWNVNKITDASKAHLTDLIYFALELDSQGNVIRKVNSQEEHAGWTHFQRILKNNQFANTPLTLAIQMLDNDDINTLLSSQAYRTNAINNLVTLVESSSLRGINIDFEPTGSIPPTTRDNFTLFVEELAQALSKHKLSGVEVSVDIYPTLFGKQRLWDLPRIAPHLSYVVIMGYDYHYRGSTTAGPVSPLRGATTYFNDDLATNLGEISRLIPANKIVLGLPFYGYRWATMTSDKYSQTIGSGITAPLRDISTLLEDDQGSLHWDRNSLTPYLVLETQSKITQIYFENDLSLGLKLDLVVSSAYQGIAIWALGYEPENSSLWQTISHKLNSQ